MWFYSGGSEVLRRDEAQKVRDEDRLQVADRREQNITAQADSSGVIRSLERSYGRKLDDIAPRRVEMQSVSPTVDVVRMQSSDSVEHLIDGAGWWKDDSVAGGASETFKVQSPSAIQAKEESQVFRNVEPATNRDSQCGLVEKAYHETEQLTKAARNFIYSKCEEIYSKDNAVGELVARALSLDVERIVEGDLMFYDV